MSYRNPHDTARCVSFTLDGSPVSIRRTPSVGMCAGSTRRALADLHADGNWNSRQPRMEVTRRTSRSRSASRDDHYRGRAPDQTPVQYRYVSSSPQRWYPEAQVRHVQPPDLGSAPPGAWVSQSTATHRYGHSRDRSTRFETRHERSYQSESRTTSPRPPADATTEHLFQHFKNTPAPDHLRNEPKNAMIWKWAEWLIAVRHVETESAWAMARIIVEERWDAVEETMEFPKIPSDNPRLQQRRNQENRGLRVHHRGNVMSPLAGRERSIPAPSLQRAHTDGETFTRGQPMERRVHWADTERPEMQNNSAGQLRPMQDAQPMYIQSSSLAQHRRSGPGDEHYRNPAQNPWFNASNATSASASQTTEWNQVIYKSNEAARTTPGHSSNPSRELALSSLEKNVIQAIKVALEMTPHASGPELYVDARLNIPMSVAQSIARGELDGDTRDMLSSLTEVIAHVPVAGQTEFEAGTNQSCRSDAGNYRPMNRTRYGEDNSGGRTRF